MSFNENFDAGTGSYTLTAHGTSEGWIDTAGFPALGCCKWSLSVVLPQGLSNTGDSLEVTTGMSFWFYYRVTDAEDVADDFSLLAVTIAFNLNDPVDFELTGADVNVADTGWQLVEMVIPPTHEGDDVDDVFINVGDPPSTDANAKVYIDTLLFSIDPPETGLTYGLTRSAGGIPGAIMEA